MPNANSFPDGQRGRIRKDDASRVGDYAASALPVGGPGMLRRRFPQGSTCFPLPTARKVPKSALTPFQLVQGTLDGDGNIQPAPATNSFVFNQYSYFRQDATTCNYTDITNLDSAISLTDGDSVWLQLDASDDGSELEEASIPAPAQTAPYEDDGNLITFGGSGTTADPYLWDQSFVPLAQAFAADPSGQPVRGGTVYTVDSLTPPTKIEVVQQTDTNLALSGVLASGRWGYMAFPDSVPLIS